MRVMHIASEYPPIQVFGLGRAVRDLAVASAAAGHEVHVVTNSIGGRDKSAVMDGVNVHRISFPPPPKPPDGVTAVMQFDVLAVQAAIEAVKRHGQPDVIHVHDWLTALPGRVLKWTCPDAKLVVTIHDTAHGKHFGELDPSQQSTADLERWIGEHADEVVCCSEHVLRELTDTYGVDPSKITIIPCGVDRSSFEVDGDLDALRETFAESDERIVLYVGRLDKEKGIQYLVEAVSRVMTVHPKTKLVIAGKGVLQEAIQKHAHNVGVGDRVLFVGYVTGSVLSGLYRRADVLVVPSTYEPFGLVALEGMVCGAPLVASTAGGLGDIVEHEQTGLSVPPADVGALAEAITRLLSDTSLAERLSDAGVRRAEEQYNWTRIALMHEPVYGVTAKAPVAALQEQV